jgi:nitroreductase
MASIREVIRRRISIRHYLPRPVPEDTLEAVVKAGEESVALAPDIVVRFHLFSEGKVVAERMTLFTGGRWLFGSAPHFIVATSEEKPHFMVNMGFRMEQMVLYATEKGLGTCWIGGMFTEGSIAELVALKPRERVIALTPLGYADTSFYGRFARNIIEAGARNFGRRKPLAEIAFGRLWGEPLETEDEVLLEALECARLAPSWANTQPWRFLVSDKEVVALADAAGRYASVREGKHYYRLDVGIAMCHFFLVAREMGWKGGWQITGFDAERIASERSIPQGFEVIGVYRR